MNVTQSAVKQLHEQTGAGYMDAKRALEKANGDVEGAIVVLREKGILIAKKKAVRIAKEGVVGIYLHSNERIGVMLEVNCESEFAAETKVFKELAHNLAHAYRSDESNLYFACRYFTREDCQRERHL